MTERKVLNKYYPPDFDPRLLPKMRLPKNRQYVIRTMAPFNMQCNTCGEYIYKGKKFNARKETVQAETYLGLEIYRFYIRCPRCLAEITFKTDLEHCDYAEEHGAKRLFEAQKIVEQAVKKEAEEEERDKTDPMRMLEKRTKMSRFEMDALARLEELKEMNVRQAKVDFGGMISKLAHNEEEILKRQEEEDENFVKSLFGIENGQKIKRILEDEEESDLMASSSSSSYVLAKKPKPEPATSIADSSKDSFQAVAGSSGLNAKSSDVSKPVSKQKQLLSGLVRRKTDATDSQKSCIQDEKVKSEHLQGSAALAESDSCATKAATGLLSLGAYCSDSSNDSDN